ncbi:hypothetical protein ACOSP7_020919 [Xanthoceras sorbifolium]
MTFSKATLLSSFTHSSVRNPATSNLRDESKHFITSHPKYILKESLMAEEDRAGVREFLYGKYKSGLCKNDGVLDAFEFFHTLENCKLNLPLKFSVILSMDCVNLGGSKWLGSDFVT